MKTSVQYLPIKHRDHETPFYTTIRNPNGDLKSRYLLTLAKNDQILTLPKTLLQEIIKANTSTKGHYQKLIDALIATSAFEKKFLATDP